MKTPGPAISLFTSVCALPQKEQRYTRLRLWLAAGTATILLHPCQRKDDSQPHVDIHVNLALTRGDRGADRPQPHPSQQRPSLSFAKRPRPPRGAAAALRFSGLVWASDYFFAGGAAPVAPSFSLASCCFLYSSIMSCWRCAICCIRLRRASLYFLGSTGAPA